MILNITLALLISIASNQNKSWACHKFKQALLTLVIGIIQF